MSIFEKLGLVKPAEEGEKKTTTVVKTKTTTSENPVVSTVMTSTVTGSEQPEIVEYFNKTFSERNFPGPDYYEYMTAIKESAGLAADEKTIFVLTFNGLKAQGCDKKKLVETAGKYLAMFAEKRDGFVKALDKTFKDEIGSRQLRLTEIENDNKQIDIEMQKLADRKVKNSETMNSLNNEITSKTNSLNADKANFEMTYNRVTKEINDNVSKINTFIP